MTPRESLEIADERVYGFYKDQPLTANAYYMYQLNEITGTRKPRLSTVHSNHYVIDA